MTDPTLELQVGSKVRVRGIRKPVVITRIRTEGSISQHFVFDYSDWRNSGTRSASTERIVAVIEA